MRKVIAVAILAAFSGCGKDNSDTSEDTGGKHSMLVAEAAALPACDADSEGWIVYVQAETKLKACTAGAWVDAPLAADKSSLVAEQWSCEGSDNLSEGADDGVSRIGVGMWVTKLTTGDFTASCVGAVFVPGSADTETYSVFIKSGDIKTIACGGSLAYVAAEFTVETGKVKYTDSENKSNSQEVSCTKS